MKILRLDIAFIRLNRYDFRSYFFIETFDSNTVPRGIFNYHLNIPVSLTSCKNKNQCKKLCILHNITGLSGKLNWLFQHARGNNSKASPSNSHKGKLYDGKGLRNLRRIELFYNERLSKQINENSSHQNGNCFNPATGFYII